MASHAEQYCNLPGNHPSLPNYLWLEGAQCFTYCGTDNNPSASPNGISSTQHLVTLLNNAGISWTASRIPGRSIHICRDACQLRHSYNKSEEKGETGREWPPPERVIPGPVSGQES
jgi:hypothetical protein